MAAKKLTLAVDDTHSVSALWQAPPKPIAVYVFAHGAGTNMAHASMATIADGLEDRGVATLRYNFPYKEAGASRPDPPKLCHITVRAAVAEAERLAPKSALFAGGRSFGGRMTSQAQALEPLARVRGLAFIAFPLHPVGKPSDERAKHLADIKIPMLFLQGTKDDLAHLALLEPVVKSLGQRAALKLLDGADHSFHVPAKSGRKDADIRVEALDAMAAWIEAQRTPKP